MDDFDNRVQLATSYMRDYFSKMHGTATDLDVFEYANEYHDKGAMQHALDILTKAAESANALSDYIGSFEDEQLKEDMLVDLVKMIAKRVYRDDKYLRLVMHKHSSPAKGTCGRVVRAGPNRMTYCPHETVHGGMCSYHWHKFKVCNYLA